MASTYANGVPSYVYGTKKTPLKIGASAISGGSTASNAISAGIAAANSVPKAPAAPTVGVQTGVNVAQQAASPPSSTTPSYKAPTTVAGTNGNGSTAPNTGGTREAVDQGQVSNDSTTYTPIPGSIPTNDTATYNPTQTIPGYVRPDYSGEINAAYDKTTEAMKAKLRANLQAALSQFGNMKNVASQQAIGSLNANDATMLQNLQRLYNSNEAQGQYGDSGANVTGRIQLGAVQGQNANAIRQDRDNYLRQLDTEANTLQSTAADQELAMTGEIDAQRLKDLQAARQFADSMDFQNRQFEYGISKDTQDRLDNLARLRTQDTQWEKSFEADQKWKEYEANQAQREQEWARSENNPAVRAQILANQITELELQNLPEMQRLQIEELKKQIAQIGAIQPQSDYEKQIQGVKLQMAKEELNQMRNPSPNQSNASSYKTSPDFAQEVQWIITNPDNAYKEIQNKSAALISKYGYDGYSELLKQATGLY